MTEKVEATTTGKIWKVLTSVGAKVETDDVLGIIESMKMEIPITAPWRKPQTPKANTARMISQSSRPMVQMMTRR